MDLSSLYLIVPVALLVIAFISMCRFVSERHVGVVERFGKFVTILRPGWNFVMPFGIDRVVDDVSLKVEELDVIEVETQTKDGVIVPLQIVVQVQVKDDDDSIYKSSYELEDPYGQIETYTIDAVRAAVPKLDVAEVFQEQSAVESSVTQALEKVMGLCGFVIKRVNVIHVDLPQAVKDAMNRIVASQRELVAATNEGEAEKMRLTKEGEGVAMFHSKVADGFRANGYTPEQSAGLLATVLYVRGVGEFAGGAGTNMVMLPPTKDLGALLPTFLAGQQPTEAGKKKA